MLSHGLGTTGLGLRHPAGIESFETEEPRNIERAPAQSPEFNFNGPQIRCIQCRQDELSKSTHGDGPGGHSRLSVRSSRSGSLLDSSETCPAYRARLSSSHAMSGRTIVKFVVFYGIGSDEAGQRRSSDCLEFQVEIGVWFHVFCSRIMTLRMVMSFLIAAMIAHIFGFPFATSLS